MLPQATGGGGAKGVRGHPTLMTIGRASDAVYRTSRARAQVLRPQGSDAESAYRLLLDIWRAWRDAPRSQHQAGQVSYSLDRAARAAGISSRHKTADGATRRERIAERLRWLDGHGALQFAEDGDRWSLLLQTLPATVQYQALGQRRELWEEQSDKLLAWWGVCWQEWNHFRYRWASPKMKMRDDFWETEMAKAQVFLSGWLAAGLEAEAVAVTYRAYITGKVRWDEASEIRIRNRFRWPNGMDKPDGIATCHYHFKRLLNDVRAAVRLACSELDQEPPQWVEADVEEIERWVGVDRHRMIRSGKLTEEQATAIAVRRNQPEGTVIAPRGSDHLYEAATPRPRRIVRRPPAPPRPPPKRNPLDGLTPAERRKLVQKLRAERS